MQQTTHLAGRSRLRNEWSMRSIRQRRLSLGISLNPLTAHPCAPVVRVLLIHYRAGSCPPNWPVCPTPPGPTLPRCPPFPSGPPDLPIRHPQPWLFALALPSWPWQYNVARPSHLPRVTLVPFPVCPSGVQPLCSRRWVPPRTDRPARFLSSQHHTLPWGGGGGFLLSWSCHLPPSPLKFSTSFTPHSHHHLLYDCPEEFCPPIARCLRQPHPSPIQHSGAGVNPGSTRLAPASRLRFTSAFCTELSTPIQAFRLVGGARSTHLLFTSTLTVLVCLLTLAAPVL